jgi:uncharacterized protein
MNQETKRIPALDSLRGIALFGILIVNAPFFLMPDGAIGNYGALTFPGWHNRLAEFVMSWFFDGKFILIFSFLFGWGMHTQMGRGPEFAPRYMRRLLGLFLIGLFHAVFLFVGDILVTYALLGVPLYFMRNLPVQKLVKLACGFWLLSVLTQSSLGLLLTSLPAPLPDHYGALVQLHVNGNYLGIVQNRITDLIGLYIITPLLFMPEVMGMFLLGLAAAKAFGETGLDAAKPLARKLLRYLWLPALLGNGLYAWANFSQDTSTAGAMIGLAMRGAFVPLLTLVYLSAAALLFDRSGFARLATLLGGEGKLSLSIYIGESVIMGLIALSYGLGLYGAISPSLAYLLCIGVYVLLLTLANLWLGAFRIGPFEWILRSITNGRIEQLTYSSRR